MRAAEAVEESLRPERVAVAERAGIAHVPADRVGAALVEDRAQAAGDVAHRLLPRDALELAGPAGALERVDHAVRAGLHVGHRDALRARIAARERMVAVGAQLLQLAVLDRGDHATQRLANTTERDPLLDRH